MADSDLNLALRVTADLNEAVQGLNNLSEQVKATGAAAGDSSAQWQQNARSVEEVVAAQVAAMNRGHAWAREETRLAEAEEAARKAAEAQAKETNKLRKDLDGLLGSIDPAQKAMGKLDAQEEKLRKSFKAGLIDKETLNDFLGKIAQQREALDTLSAGTRKFSLNSRTAARELRFTVDELISGRYGYATSNIFALGNQLGFLPPIFSATTLAVGGFVAAIGGMGYAVYTSLRDEEAFNRSLQLTGNITGQTAAGLEKLTGKLGQAKGDFASVRDVLNGLVSGGQYTGKTLNDVAGAAVAMMQLTGKSADDTVQSFSRMSSSVTDWALESNQQYHWLDLATYQRIASLEKQGDKEAAISLASQRYTQVAQERLGDLKSQLNWLESAWDGVTEAVGRFGNALRRDLKVSMGLGNIEEQIQKLEEAKRLGMYSTFGQPIPWNKGMEKDLQDLYQQRDAQTKTSQKKADQQKANDDAIAAQKKLQQTWDNNRTSIEKEADAVEQLRQNYEALWKTATGRETLQDRGVASTDGKHFSGGQWDTDVKNLNPDEKKAEQYNNQLKQRLTQVGKLTELEKVEADIRDGRLQNASAAEQNEARALAKRIDAQVAANKAMQAAASQNKRTFEDNQRFVQSLQHLAAKRSEDAAVTRTEEIATRNLTAAQRAQAEAANAIITAQEFKQQNFQLQLQLMRASGQQEQAQMAELHAQLGKQRENFVASGNTEGVSLIDKLLPLQETQIRVNEIKRQLDELEQYRSRQENHIQAEVQTGLISEIEGRQQLVDLHQQVADKISATLPELREMAKLPGAAGENIRKMLEDLDTELLKLRATTGSLTQAFKDGLQDGIESSLKGLATGTMSLSSAVLNLGQSIVNAMAQIAAQKLAQMAISGLSSGAGAIGLGALFAATGGYISGPGTATSDSIPARLSDGEYVVRAAAVSHYGVDFLHALNATRLRKFATGGLVNPLYAPALPSVTASTLSDAPTLNSQAPAPVIQQTLVMDAGEAFRRGINTVEGERAIMTYIRVNKQTIAQELGVNSHGS
ncbi:phage tail length tape measure family protein [Salmonella enterica]|nr:phage tail length tape measure family protein [Salmonella enterica]EJF5856687.1 phage tail length tape measure family protein [Salmonella enterica]EJF5948052.1 phage tail length tape measure family protein [Salmonella enterica]EJF6158037.1 phage tail length tape measure family protein [Salmonella enterica]EJF6377317.1 phage tail length tape measure family protein [Salmonella enterica]